MPNITAVCTLASVVLLVCLESFVVGNTVGVPVGGLCSQNANCTANDTNTVCNKTCQCKSTHYKGATCLIKKDNNVTCGSSIECKDLQTTCRDKRCQCFATHYWNSACKPRILGNTSCTGDFCIQNAACVKKVCKCNTGFKLSADKKTCSGTERISTQICMVMLSILVAMNVSQFPRSQ